MLSPSQTEAVARFAAFAEAYCACVEAHRQMAPVAFLIKQLELLPQLYCLGAALPTVEPSDDVPISDRLTNDEWGVLFGSLQAHLEQYEHYWEVYDPSQQEPDDVVAGSLADDFADIHRDLRAGLSAWHKATDASRVDAVWEWREAWENHWGFHAVDAIRGMHWHLQDYRNKV